MNRRVISMLLGLGIFLLMIALKALQVVEQVG
jgi:hypothetical protein